ncbi:hypothetical protein NQ318_001476 [Aromia moschata]|uniref:HTH psq-type domain-containing protein n=1 Tax=Aromia moschata TaxID=1265417 RepID=A0AAV8XF87_9CUCU|nr:hypothetical protein NQ318_001476 [Aromia moschata]
MYNILALMEKTIYTEPLAQLLKFFTALLSSALSYRGLTRIVPEVPDPTYRWRLLFENNNYKKLQVIEYFKNGMKNKDLSEKYKVRHSAISKIIHNKDKILQHKKTMEK